MDLHAGRHAYPSDTPLDTYASPAMPGIDDECDDDGFGVDLPCSLTGILEPDEALAAAQRMQRWYRTTPQGAAHSFFGRDGRKIEGRYMLESSSDEDY
jgi:hypothetical protein